MVSHRGSYPSFCRPGQRMGSELQTQCCSWPIIWSYSRKPPLCCKSREAICTLITSVYEAYLESARDTEGKKNVPFFLNEKSHRGLSCLLPRKPLIMIASPQKAATGTLRHGIDTSENTTQLALPLCLNTLCNILARILLLQSAPRQRKDGAVPLISKSVAQSRRLPCEWDQSLLWPRGSLEKNNVCFGHNSKMCFLN